MGHVSIFFYIYTYCLINSFVFIIFLFSSQNHEDLKKIIRNLASIMRQLAQNYIYLQTKKIESLLTFIISSLKVLMWIITSGKQVWKLILEEIIFKIISSIILKKVK